MFVLTTILLAGQGQQGTKYKDAVEYMYALARLVSYDRMARIVYPPAKVQELRKFYDFTFNEKELT